MKRNVALACVFVGVAMVSLASRSAPGEDKLRPHPRLLLRPKAAKGIPGLDEIVTRAKRAPWSARLDELKETTHGLALHWLLTGDEESARRCQQQLAKLDPDEGYGLFVQGPCFTLPIAYDWLASWKGFTEKKAIETKIAKQAEDGIRFLESDGHHVFHTSAPRAAMTVGLAGLALEGEHARAGAFRAFAIDYLEKRYFPCMKFLDGGGVAGMTYSVHEGFAPLCYLLWALRTAHDLDYFSKEKWLASRMDYIVEQMLPDLTFQRWGDCVAGSRCGCADETRGIVDMMADGLESRAGWALSSRIAKKHPGRQGYHASVLPTFFLFGRDPGETAIELPPWRLFGEKSIGQVFFRTGWEESDTVVFFKAGDTLDAHGHFDQGSFTIWRREPLAIDAGCYEAYDDHRMKFARTTVAHDTLLVGPDDERGGQRIVQGMDSRDLDDFLAKRTAKKLEAGRIIAFQAEKDHGYVSADLTAAYDPAHARLVTRELVWIEGALVVLDKVDTASRSRFILHSKGDVTIEGTRFVLPGKAASLHGVTLLPKGAKLTRVKSNSVDGHDYPPAHPNALAGEQRLEVEGPSGTTVFLHVLFPLDEGASPPAVKLVEATGSVGVEIGKRRVVFKTAGVSNAVTIK